MPPEPVPADPGWDEDLAWLDRLCQADDDPAGGPQEYWDPESCAPPPGRDELTEQELAGIAEAAADEMLALDAASTGRRGPGRRGCSRGNRRAGRLGSGPGWRGT